MVREVLTPSGWKSAESYQIAPLDPVCPQCGGRGLGRDRNGELDLHIICGTCQGKGRIRENGNA